MDELTKSIKRHLRVTYSHLDEELIELVQEAKAVINATCGECDFEAHGLARMLVKAYCRYSWSGAPEAFESNNRALLIKLQLDNGVKNRAQT